MRTLSALACWSDTPVEIILPTGLRGRGGHQRQRRPDSPQSLDDGRRRGHYRMSVQRVHHVSVSYLAPNVVLFYSSILHQLHVRKYFLDLHDSDISGDDAFHKLQLSLLQA